MAEDPFQVPGLETCGLVPKTPMKTADGWVTIWQESMNPTGLVSTVQAAGGGGVTVW